MEGGDRIRGASGEGGGRGAVETGTRSPHSMAGSRGVVAAESELVAQAGERIFREGGNAFDAAAAACLACAVRHPDKNGVGGYLMAAVVLEGESGRVWSLDANARAPAAAHEHMYEVGPVGTAPRGPTRTSTTARWPATSTSTGRWRWRCPGRWPASAPCGSAGAGCPGRGSCSPRWTWWPTASPSATPSRPRSPVWSR